MIFFETFFTIIGGVAIIWLVIILLDKDYERRKQKAYEDLKKRLEEYDK